MKTTQLISAIALFAAAGSLYAADITGNFDYHSDFTSTESRAEVRAELAQARAQGLLMKSDADEPTALDIKRIESNIGARGPAGARDSTRGESAQSANRGFDPAIYFGD